jgi:hypothetical protein
MVLVTLNSELGKMWRKPLMAHCTLVPHHFYYSNRKKKMKILSQDSRFRGRNSNRGPRDSNKEQLLHLHRSFKFCRECHCGNNHGYLLLCMDVELSSIHHLQKKRTKNVEHTTGWLMKNAASSGPWILIFDRSSALGPVSRRVRNSVWFLLQLKFFRIQHHMWSFTLIG